VSYSGIQQNPAYGFKRKQVSQRLHPYCQMVLRRIKINDSEGEKREGNHRTSLGIATNSY
jgi:hypothetical protein